jgi:hypothetical protein
MTVEITVPLSAILALFAQIPPGVWASVTCFVIGGIFILIGLELKASFMIVCGAALAAFGGLFLAMSVATVVLATAPPLPPAWDGAVNWTWPISVKVV